MGPPHPRGFIKRSVLPHGLSVTMAAAALGVDGPAPFGLTKDRGSLSPEMALPVEKAFGVKMNPVLEMQVRCDAGHTRRREDEIDMPALARS